MNIYPFFEESIAYLKELGYYMDLQINVEDVDRIYVTNQNSEAYRKMYELQKTEEGKEAIHADMPEAAKSTGFMTLIPEGMLTIPKGRILKSWRDAFTQERCWSTGGITDVSLIMIIRFLYILRRTVK